MIDSIAKLGRELLLKDNGIDPKQALINLLVDKNIIAKSVQANPKKPKQEPILYRIILEPNNTTAKVERFSELVPHVLEKYRYVFEYMHPKKMRPRLSFKKTGKSENDLKKLNDNLKRVVSFVDTLKSKGKITQKMEELRQFLEPIHSIKKMDFESDSDKEALGIYTVAIDRGKKVENLAESEGYKDLLYADIRLEHEIEPGVCSLCSSQQGVIVDPDLPSGSLLKIYITDQPCFISHIPTSQSMVKPGLKRTFTPCPECLSAILVGHHFIVNSRGLAKNIKKTNITMHIIPHSESPFAKIERIAKRVENITSSPFSSLETLRKLEKEMEEENFYMTLIFGAREQASFKLYGTVRQAPVTRLASYIITLNILIETILRNVYTEESPIPRKELEKVLSFKEVADIVPLRVRGGEVIDAEPILLLYNAILKGEFINPRKLVDMCLTVARIHYYGISSGYTIEPDKRANLALSRTVIAYKLLQTALDRLSIPTSKVNQETIPELPDHLKQVLVELNYSKEETPLFLLGYVMGEIGAYQMAARAERSEFPPIIKKLSFEGMRREALMRLAADIVEAMRNYNVVGRDVLTAWSHSQIAITQNIGKLNDPLLNVFHILTGYAYSTLRRMAGKAKSEKDAESGVEHVT